MNGKTIRNIPFYKYTTRVAIGMENEKGCRLRHPFSLTVKLVIIYLFYSQPGFCLSTPAGYRDICPVGTADR